ncbi:MAG: HD domain-containing protein, partial [Acidobacteria bacterium]
MALSIVGGLEDIMAAMEARYPAVAAHCRRVSLYAVRLATQYGLPASTIETIRVGSLLHDLGKLEVPERILEKPGRLTEREWARLRHHPESGLALVQRLGFDEAVAEIVLYHHERIDGSGYADSLAGETITWAGRIVNVLDALATLTRPRTY